MTLDGTNTWVLSAPGARRAVVVDPGPEDEGHLAAVVAPRRSAARGSRSCCSPTGTWTTARRRGRFAGRRGRRRCGRWTRRSGWGRRAWRAGTSSSWTGSPRGGGDARAHRRLAVFVLPDSGGLLTGDTVLGRGTTVVAHPDGRLADYLDSLRRLERARADARCCGPAARARAGPAPTRLGVRPGYLRAPGGAARAGAGGGRGRRRGRRAGRRAGLRRRDRALWPAAELSVRAQLEYLGVR